MSKYSSSIAKYDEIIEYQNYDEYMADMEIYQILHSNSPKIDFIVDGDEEIVERARKPSIK